MRASRLASAVLAMLVLTSCVCPCDPGRFLHDASSRDARDCGYVPLGMDRTSAIDCAMTAISAHQAFHVGWQAIGRDTEQRRYFAGTASGTFTSFSYGGPVNGSASCGELASSNCSDTPTRASDATGPAITCTLRPGTENIECQ